MGQGSSEEALPDAIRLALQPLATALIGFEAEIAKLDKEILATYRKHDVSLRLASVAGIGPITASFLTASILDPGLFEGGREFAAFFGLVPRQYSSGGKPKLGRISKMGNRHLRKLLAVGAHAALYSIKSGKTKSPLADWARALLAKKSFKLVAVALANKMARIAWAIMTRARSYEANLAMK